jgi:hypothetical protein
MISDRKIGFPSTVATILVSIFSNGFGFVSALLEDIASNRWNAPKRTSDFKKNSLIILVMGHLF